MEEFKKNLAALIKVKTLITLTVVAVLAYGFVVGRIDAEKFMIVAVTVITYYFNKKDEADTTTTITTTGTPKVE
jgi:hypothetical protein